MFPVELDGNPTPETRVQYNTILTEVAATASSMSPDTNHNELLSDNATGECFSSRMNGIHKEAAIPEELLQDKVTMHRRSPADAPSEAKTSLVDVQDGEDEERIQEYLQRSDTAVIYPEPVGRPNSGKSGTKNVCS